MPRSSVTFNTAGLQRGSQDDGALDFDLSDFGALAGSDAVTVEPAHTPERRQAANRLLRERYRWRGYAEPSLPVSESTYHLPLVATCQGEPIGTLTVSLEGPQGLGCEALFPDEIQALRDAGLQLSEFTRLAIDPERGSRNALASLFHVAYLVASRLGKADTVLLEVNPRHVAYYRRILGARIVGGERFHPRVKAPAVLLAISFHDVRARIERVTGNPLAAQAISFFSMAFTAAEEDAIVARIDTHVRTRGVQYEPFRFRMQATEARTVQGFVLSA